MLSMMIMDQLERQSMWDYIKDPEVLLPTHYLYHTYVSL